MLRTREEERYKGEWVESYQELALRLTTAALAVGGEVLPEEGVVDVTTAVEVEQRGLRSGSLGVALGLSLGEGLDGSVEAVDIGLMVLGVVKLHDLAGDVGLERAVVVCVAICCQLCCAVRFEARMSFMSCYRNSRTYTADRGEWPCRG